MENPDFQQQYIAEITSSFETFKRKMMQQQYFQIQTVLVEKFFTQIKDKPEFINDSLVVEYEKFNEALKSLGKSYQDIHNEKIFSDKFRSFEELLYDFFNAIFTLMPKFLIEPNDDKINVRFFDLFEKPDIENCKIFTIESKIKKYMQGSNIIDTIKKYTTVFKTPLTVTDDEFKECFRISQIRNILTHNNGIINTIYHDQLAKFGILPDYSTGSTILPFLNDEISKAHNVLLNLGTKLCDNIIQDFNRIQYYYENKKYV